MELFISLRGHSICFLFNWCLSFQAECYHYLFDAAIKLNQVGLDWSTPNHGPIQKGVLGSVGNINTSVKAGADSNHEIEPLRVSLQNVLPFIEKSWDSRPIVDIL